MKTKESAILIATRKRNNSQHSRTAVMKKCRMPIHDVAVIVDISGRITDCTPEASSLLGHHSNGLSGLELTEVIPKLPICSNTPYYNLAYAVFHSGNERPMQRMATAADGRKIPVNISLSRTVIKGRHLIKINLASAPSGVANE